MENADSELQEKPIYQFYTIINNGAGLVYNQEEQQESLYKIDENDESADQIVYVTLNPTEEGEEDSNNVDGLINENIYENITSPSNGLKFVTFEDGQLYITSADNSDLSNLESNCPLLTNINEDSQTFVDDVTLVANEDEIIESVEEGDSNYRKIRLEDGTCALIDASVWDSLIQETSPQETETKNKRKFHCTYVNCGKSFTTSHHLQVHNRSHTGDRPHACNVEGCDKAFATGYSLKAHLRTHTGEKPYGCTICLKHFKTSGDLQKHIRTHTGEKPFKCPIEGCDKSFTTSNIRKVHIRSHTGERPYVCEVAECGKSFASATNYKNHMRIHSGEKPYLCSVPGCGKRFTEYSSLYKHNAVHQPYKMFRCDYCDQLFKFENTLRLHRKTAHTIIKTEDGTEFYFSDQQKSMVLEINESEDLNAIMDPNLLTDESNLQYDDGEI